MRSWCCGWLPTNCPLVIRLTIHDFSTGAAKKTHGLGIELIPDVSDLLTDEVVKLDGLFDFFD